MVRITPTSHDGLAALELVDRGTRMVIVHAVGPRIAAFGSAHANSLLFWDRAHVHTRGAWRLYGGHRLWITRPDADESEEAYAPDNEPCRVRELERGVAITAPPSASCIERTIAVHGHPTGWMVEHRLRNVGDMLWSGGAWALTCTLPSRGTRYRVPLDGGSSRWNILTMVVPRQWGGEHTSPLVDSQFRLTEDALLFQARGREAKRMLGTPRGRLEMSDPSRGAFAKFAVPIKGARYPLNTNVAVYLGPKAFMVELETMSPLMTLAPGQTLRHVEFWRHLP